MIFKVLEDGSTVSIEFTADEIAAREAEYAAEAAAVPETVSKKQFQKVAIGLVVAGNQLVERTDFDTPSLCEVITTSMQAIVDNAQLPSALRIAMQQAQVEYKESSELNRNSDAMRDLQEYIIKPLLTFDFDEDAALCAAEIVDELFRKAR